MKDEQFNKGQARPKGKLGSKPNGGSDMQDEQFDKGNSYDGVSDSGSASAGKKTKGGMKFTAGERSPAHKIMSEVAKFAQKDNSSISKNKVSNKKVSKPTGGKQSKDFKKSSKKSIPFGESSEE